MWFFAGHVPSGELADEVRNVRKMAGNRAIMLAMAAAYDAIIRILWNHFVMRCWNKYVDDVLGLGMDEEKLFLFMGLGFL